MIRALYPQKVFAAGEHIGKRNGTVCKCSEMSLCARVGKLSDQANSKARRVVQQIPRPVALYGAGPLFMRPIIGPKRVLPNHREWA